MHTKESKRETHPQQNSNFLSKIFFCWTFPMFRKGLKKELSDEDVYPILARHESHKLANQMEKEWLRQQKSSTKPSVWRAIWRIFKWDILQFLALSALLSWFIRIIRPFALGKLMGYYSFSNEAESSEYNNVIYAAVIIITTIADNVCNNLCTDQCLQLAMRVKVACSALVYRKTLRLSNRVLGEISIGHIVNLLSNDMAQLTNFWPSSDCVWCAPVQTAIILYLIYSMCGPTALVGVGFVLALIPLQLILSKKVAALQLKSAVKTDERIRHMNEIISGIQVIKVYTWEQSFVKLVQLIRRQEMRMIKILLYLEVWLSSFTYFVNRSAVFLCVLTYVLTGNSPNAQYVFVLFSFYLTLMGTLSWGLPAAVSDTLKANVSIKRLENFFNLEETENKTASTTETGIRIENATAKWSKNPQDNTTLQDINFCVLPQQTVAIVGSVGSGKSSLLQLCLGEISLLDGSVQIGGKISYANQEPWLFGGTVKDNILFGQPMVHDRYDEVIRICALVDDLSHFPYGDNSIVGERGILLSGGQKARINLARALYREADIYLLDDPLSAVDAKVGKQIFNNCINGYLKNKCTVLVTHQIQYLTLVDSIYLLSEGRIISSGSYKDLQESLTDFGRLLENSHNEEHDGENVEQKAEVQVCRKENESEEKRASVFLLFAMTESCAIGADYFVTFWVNLEQKRATPNITVTAFEELFFTRANCVYFYSSIIGVLIILTVTRTLSFVKICVHASVHLHDKLFASVVNACMDFFYRNSSGRVLNRFARDIGSIDKQLPDLILTTVQILLSICGSLIAISVISPLTLLPALVVFVVMYYIRKIFLASSLCLKRMESTFNSPIYAHVSESAKGLTTIRALRANQIVEKEFYNLQNLHSSVRYMNLSANRAFAIWLDNFCVLYLLSATVFALTRETLGGNIGFVITRAVGLTGMFQWGIRMWSSLENEMTSVERVVEYTQIEQENDDKKKVPSSLWPDAGKLEFRSVCMQYSAHSPYVLKKLNFVVKPREKVGIVGRTGAGKSSLIPVLFRLVNFEGHVLIDDVDTKDIALSTLRSNISIIPQDPVIFAGSVRKNLDPFDLYDDNKIWNVLEEVQLKDFVRNLPSGMFSQLSEGGSNFSVGQKQLICLARALLKKNKILILDEATANVDPQTDELLQKTIRKNFEDCTVLTIAHRLHTIMDSDKVIVMDGGIIVEFDHPNVLLNNKGVFYNLVMETGKSMGKKLLEIAQKNYHIKEH
ncbi:putative multidrug resistance-associated protein lethal(2)03659-like Protein [Tribolium castaneum]|uniref:Putative multidrug resistance-associated protein lethal(2)03659-like Protein n=1 Tax=Tribolium castaneum TaxID=7070 RepID=A0A139WI35_TRICA|nr:putative multidrug resistance-associated protein lethal(2)03659-like Protein [Tribolium castaneum]